MTHYVEVVYLSRMQYQKRKYIQYKDFPEADGVYQVTIKKLTKEKKNALVCLRGEAGLIKSELIK